MKAVHEMSLSLHILDHVFLVFAILLSYFSGLGFPLQDLLWSLCSFNLVITTLLRWVPTQGPDFQNIPSVIMHLLLSNSSSHKGTFTTAVSPRSSHHDHTVHPHSLPLIVSLRLPLASRRMHSDHFSHNPPAAFVKFWPVFSHFDKILVHVLPVLNFHISGERSLVSLK